MSRSTKWGMILVLLLAAVCRLWMLPAFPLGLHYDEAANVILTRQIAEQGYRPVFIRPYTGKEVLFFYASAPWISMTGGQTWSTRLSAAMLGILTVAVTYAMTQELFGRGRNSQTALYAAAWMAVSFPHIVLSRYGFRAITQPLMQGLAVMMVWRGLRTRKTWVLVVGGVLVGLTAYTYLAARLFPVPLAIAMGVLWLQAPKHRRSQYLHYYALIIASATISFAPLGVFFLQNPGAFGTRISQVAASTISEAGLGLWACVKALVLPGQGDPYVRFNLPGHPVLDGLSALMACAGLVVFIRAKFTGRLSQAGRIMVLTTIAVMLLPSALATAEITPSNLRLVGVFPFLVLLPALGLNWLSHSIPSKLLRGLAVLLLFLALGITSWSRYGRWSQSTALFYAADGEMVLAAQAADHNVGENITVYISSEHYQHPTVAVLSKHFNEIKWNTGGASFILPPAGDAVRIVPRSAQSPMPWPEQVAGRIEESWLYAPDGSSAVAIQYLSSEDVNQIKQEMAISPAKPMADFAHIIAVHELVPLENCASGQKCTISLVWQVRAPTEDLQPMIRIFHPVTGEWARTMPFHYPVAQWTPGDIVLDQIQLHLPPGMPPGRGYQLAVSMVDTRSQNLLPRLVREQFSGLEYSTVIPAAPPWPALPQSPLTAEQMRTACEGVSREQSQDLEHVRLLGWLLPTKPISDVSTVEPGELLLVTLCWEVLKDTGVYEQVQVVLQAAEKEDMLYEGPPAGGYTFEEWLPGTAVEDRYALRLPREMDAGPAFLQLRVLDGAGNSESINLAQLEVQSVVRSFSQPEPEVPLDAQFGDAISLLGYDIDPQLSSETVGVTLYWQSIQTIEQDYVIFIHLVDPASGEIVSQVDANPRQGGYPTSMWAAGEVIMDTHHLHFPASYPEGGYILRTGLYIPMTGVYLMTGGEREFTAEIEIP